jgi:hypothetical protein
MSEHMLRVDRLLLGNCESNWGEDTKRPKSYAMIAPIPSTPQ